MPIRIAKHLDYAEGLTAHELTEQFVDTFYKVRKNFATLMGVKALHANVYHSPGDAIKGTRWVDMKTSTGDPLPATQQQLIMIGIQSYLPRDSGYLVSFHPALPADAVKLDLKA
jgi:hypothetical protein